jgi:hypothetical protein
MRHLSVQLNYKVVSVDAVVDRNYKENVSDVI